MDAHNINTHDWNPSCDYLSGREELIASTLKLVLEKKVVVIRATPLVGKTTLLRLLGRHILFNCPSLEPIWIHWQKPNRRLKPYYKDFLDDNVEVWRRRNAKHRAPNPEAKLIYIIDEAQNSYSEHEFWSEEIKSRSLRSNPLFILVCVYGSAGQNITGFDNGILSEAISTDPSQRIELQPSFTGAPCMLFNSKETTTVVRKWAVMNKYTIISGVIDYIQLVTGGHPGMVGLVLQYFTSRFSQ
ncbi:hypothetical protein MMC09_003275, partial [Bachmanniomyces sp. S44760]|nr:hypothetical protein [Bachmanniomyces sp. S44760]